MSPIGVTHFCHWIFYLMFFVINLLSWTIDCTYEHQDGAHETAHSKTPAILSIAATLIWQRHREQARQKKIKREYHKKVLRYWIWVFWVESVLGGEGCSVQTVKPQQRIQQERGDNLFTPQKYSIFVFSQDQNILQVLKVGENVYVAIGYGLANSIMLEVINVVGVIIINKIIISDCVEGWRRGGHHRYFGELRSGQGGSRGLWGGEMKSFVDILL